MSGVGGSGRKRGEKRGAVNCLKKKTAGEKDYNQHINTQSDTRTKHEQISKLQKHFQFTNGFSLMDFDDLG